jgi:glycosyltransferase involved in cell wall biosynthesis
MDALPTVLLQAGAASVPTISTNIGGVPEIVQDDVTGILIEPPPTASKLIQVLKPLLVNPQLRAKLGTQAKQHIEQKFTAKRWAQELYHTYETVLNETNWNNK